MLRICKSHQDKLKASKGGVVVHWVGDGGGFSVFNINIMPLQSAFVNMTRKKTVRAPCSRVSSTANLPSTAKVNIHVNSGTSADVDGRRRIRMILRRGKGTRPTHHLLPKPRVAWNHHCVQNSCSICWEVRFVRVKTVSLAEMPVRTP